MKSDTDNHPTPFRRIPLRDIGALARLLGVPRRKVAAFVADNKLEETEFNEIFSRMETRLSAVKDFLFQDVSRRRSRITAKKGKTRNE